jgi:hypothetical protein
MAQPAPTTILTIVLFILQRQLIDEFRDDTPKGGIGKSYGEQTYQLLSTADALNLC